MNNNFLGNTATDIVNSLFEKAVHKHASDIHIDPTLSFILVRFRIHGELQCYYNIHLKFHEEIISRMKILAGARTDIHAKPQDARFRIAILGGTYNVRVSFMPTSHGENVVCRLLQASYIHDMSFANLGFTPEHVVCISKALQCNHGLILVTGPTGSGKTTTLRTCLTEKTKEQISVIALEDPVEYEIHGVRHIHIRESQGFGFTSGLRSVLRQDPDVIMIGEIRDEETAKTATTTALTGHLVLSTLHTNSALETLTRLIDMNIERYLLVSTLRLIISQRLVRIVCKQCFSSEDCVFCGGVGYVGRKVIAEVLVIDDKLGEFISKGATQLEIGAYLKGQSFFSLKDHAEALVSKGVTTRFEVTRSLSTHENHV